MKIECPSCRQSIDVAGGRSPPKICPSCGVPIPGDPRAFEPPDFLRGPKEAGAAERAQEDNSQTAPMQMPIDPTAGSAPGLARLGRPPADATEFCARVVQSGVLDKLTLDRFLATPLGRQVADNTRRLALALADAGLITRWQGKQLWDGQIEGLVLDRRYVLIDHIGKGGMGAVYKARHILMNREVALKVARRDARGVGSVLERFRREVAASAKLDHPNLLRAHDVVQVGDRIVLVLEYVNGPNLHQLVSREGPVPVPVACDLIRQAALGLNHVHQLGMIHRDIKPSNMLLAPNAEGRRATSWGKVKISDLGLVRLESDSDDDRRAARVDVVPGRVPGEGSSADDSEAIGATVGLAPGEVEPKSNASAASGSDSATPEPPAATATWRPDHTPGDVSPTPDRDHLKTLTLAGAVMGTLDYMAPEQAEDTHRVDHHADIYSLGATLFFLLTGEPPFGAGGDKYAKLTRLLTDSPPRLRDSRMDCPEELDRFVGRMLARRPEDRPSSAAEIAEQLLRYCNPDQPGGALAPSQIPDWLLAAQESAPSVTLRRAAATRPTVRPALAWSALVAMLVLVVSAATWVIWLRRDRPAPRVLPPAPPIVVDRGPVPVLATDFRAPADLRNADVFAGGDRVAVCASDGTVRVWNIDLRRYEEPVLQHPAPVVLAFAYPDGGRILTFAEDYTARGWSIDHQKVLFSVRLTTEWFSSIALSGDGRRFAAVPPRSNRFHLWDAETGHIVTGTELLGGSCAFSTDGKLLAGRRHNHEGPIGIVQSETGTLLRQLGENYAVHQTAPIVFALNGEWIGSILSDGRPFVVEVATGRLYSLNARTAHPIAFLDNERILVLIYQGTWHAWNWKDDTLEELVLPDGSAEVRAGGRPRRFVISPFILAANLKSVGREIMFADQATWIGPTAWSHDSRRLAFASTDGLFVWDLARGKLVVRELTPAIAALESLPNGNFVACLVNGRIVIIDGRTGEERRQLFVSERPEARLLRLHVLDDARLVLAWSYQTAVLLRLDTGERVKEWTVKDNSWMADGVGEPTRSHGKHTLLAGTRSVLSLRIGDSGQLLDDQLVPIEWGDPNNRIVLNPLNTGMLRFHVSGGYLVRQSFPPPDAKAPLTYAISDPVALSRTTTRIAWDPFNVDRVVIHGIDGVVRTLQLKDRRLDDLFVGPIAMDRFAFSPNGRMILTAGRNRWDVFDAATGEHLFSYQNLPALHWVAINPRTGHYQGDNPYADQYVRYAVEIDGSNRRLMPADFASHRPTWRNDPTKLGLPTELFAPSKRLQAGQ